MKKKRKLSLLLVATLIVGAGATVISTLPVRERWEFTGREFRYHGWPCLWLSFTREFIEPWKVDRVRFAHLILNMLLLFSPGIFVAAVIAYRSRLSRK